MSPGEIYRLGEGAVAEVLSMEGETVSLQWVNCMSCGRAQLPRKQVEARGTLLGRVSLSLQKGQFYWFSHRAVGTPLWHMAYAADKFNLSITDVRTGSLSHVLFNPSEHFAMRAVNPLLHRVM